MKHILTLSLCFLALTLSAQENCLSINEEINDFVEMGTFDSHQYYISEGPVPLSDGFYEYYNDLASLYSGNLLTIGSSEEDEYVYSTFFNGGFSNLSSYYYIGLYNTNPSNLCCGQGNPPGVWEWINGESVEYTNWDINANQPSGDELYASGGGSWGGVWADVSGGHQGYIIIEVEQCPVSVSGCLDSLACNFNEYATEDDGSCDYTCCPGPGCCNVGTVWNIESQTCIVLYPSDSNFDGCVDLDDLLDLLGTYGFCISELPDFTACGDAIEHEGYSYSTVEIGDQCWFSENCRYLPVVSPSSYSSTTDPDYYVYGYEGSTVSEAKATENYETYGVLYNWPAVMTEGICPSDWHIPTDGEFTELVDFLGGESVAGGKMKEAGDDHWDLPNTGATNSSGFNGLPGGSRYAGGFITNGDKGYWWSASVTSPGSSGSLRRRLDSNSGSISRGSYTRNYGFSARCIMD